MSYYHEASLDFYHQNQLASAYGKHSDTPSAPWDLRIVLFIGLGSLLAVVSRYMYMKITRQIWAMKHSIMNEMRDSLTSEIDKKIRNLQGSSTKSTDVFNMEAALDKYVTQDEYKKKYETMKQSIMNELDKRIGIIQNELNQYVSNKQFMNNVKELVKITDNERIYKELSDTIGTLHSNMINTKQLAAALKQVALKNDIETLRKDISLVVNALDHKMGSNTNWLHGHISKSEISQA